MVLALLSVWGCKDDEPKPENTVEISDLLGTWVSLDSMIVQKNGTYEYTRNYLFFDTSEYNNGEIFKPYMVKTGHRDSEYRFELIGLDSLYLWYMGPKKIGLINNLYTHRLILNESKDSMEIIGFKNTYEHSPFDKFYKVK